MHAIFTKIWVNIHYHPVTFTIVCVRSTNTNTKWWTLLKLQTQPHSLQIMIKQWKVSKVRFSERNVLNRVVNTFAKQKQKKNGRRLYFNIKKAQRYGCRTLFQILTFS